MIPYPPDWVMTNKVLHEKIKSHSVVVCAVNLLYNLAYTGVVFTKFMNVALLRSNSV